MVLVLEVDLRFDECAAQLRVGTFGMEIGQLFATEGVDAGLESGNAQNMSVGIGE